MEGDPYLYYFYGATHPPEFNLDALYIELYTDNTAQKTVVIAPLKVEDSLNSWRMFCQKQRLTLNDKSNKETEMTKLVLSK